MAGEHDLRSLLTMAYGSASRAEAALDRALTRAALDEPPASPVQLVSFLRTHVHPVVEADLGSMIAGALLEHVLGRMDGAAKGSPPSSRGRPLAQVSLRPATPRRRRSAEAANRDADDPISGPRRKAPCVMLIRVDRCDEGALLGLDALAVRVVRVRHPLPACERMRILRPPVVVVGSGISDPDRDLLTEAAREAGSQLVEQAAFVAPSALRAAIRRAVQRAANQPTPGEYDDLPDSKQAPARKRKT